MAALRFSTKGSGARCVMIIGISTMLKWCVVSLVFITRLPLHKAQNTVRDLILFGWTMSLAKEERLHCLTAHMLAGE